MPCGYRTNEISFPSHKKSNPNRYEEWDTIIPTSLYFQNHDDKNLLSNLKYCLPHPKVHLFFGNGNEITIFLIPETCLK